MELFNEYRNKDFYYFVNIINKFILNYDDIKIDDIKNYLNKTKSFNEMIDFVEGKNNEYQLFLKNDDNKTLRLNNIIDWETYNKSNDNIEDKTDNHLYPIPIRLSYVERAWLYYIMNDNKIRLFLDDDVIDKIKKLLLDNEYDLPYPLSNNDIYHKKLNNNPPHHYTDDEIKNFRAILKALKDNNYIKLTNNADSGICYKDSIVIPYKIEYNCKQETFSLTCLNQEKTDIIRMFFTNLSNVEVLENNFNSEEINSIVKDLLNNMRKEIIIEIDNQDNAPQRCSYLFANYEREIYTKDNKIHMKLKYYKEYQYEDIIYNILFLGKYVKVISPENVVEEIKNIIKEKICNYYK